MNSLAKIGSMMGLAAVVAPPMMYLAGWLSLAVVQGCALVGTMLWFALTPSWMGRKLPLDAKQVEI